MIEIKRPGPDRSEEIAKMAALTFGETFVGKAYYTQPLVDGYAEKFLTTAIFDNYLRDPKHQFFIASVDGKTAGFSHLTEREPVDCIKPRHAIYLNRLYLKKEFHRRGLGSHLLDECFAEARRRGYQWLWLSVWEHNNAARLFYERSGFKQFGEWDWPFESHGVKYVDRDLIYAVEI